MGELGGRLRPYSTSAAPKVRATRWLASVLISSVGLAPEIGREPTLDEGPATPAHGRTE
jgi:hypothetical protein